MPLPLDIINELAINRQNTIPSNKSDEDFTRHHYPFSTLPLLKSHIRPHYVIFNAGLKLFWLSKHDSRKCDSLVTEFPTLGTIISLYKAWLYPVPIDADNDLSYNAPDVSDDDDDKSSSSNDPKDRDYVSRTKSVRLGSPRRSKRNEPSEQNVPVVDGSNDHNAPRRSKRKASPAQEVPVIEPVVKGKRSRQVLSESSNHNQLLSELTLSSLNQQMGGVSTNDRIYHWLNSTRVRKKRKFYPIL